MICWILLPIRINSEKKIGQDIIEGKKTLLVVKARETVTNTKDIELLDKFFNNNGLSEDYIDDMKDLFDRNNILQYAEELADYYFTKSKLALQRLEQNDYTAMLNWLLDSLNKRAY